MAKREPIKNRNALEGTHSAKLDRVLNRQTGRSIKGFDVTLYPSDFDGGCTLERKCIKKAGHAGTCWPNGVTGEASRVP